MNQDYTESGPLSFVSGVLVGSLLGAIVMLWLAPQSGKKTQQMLRRQAVRLQRTAEDTVDDLKNSAEQVTDDVREKVADARHDGRGWLNQRANQAGKMSSKIRDAVAQ